ncbi:PREDICTED: structural maintenance of chromosomes protein 6-like [Priapulus caudatus]|uniref:Structural maintenance of chromosomes protein 6-like n=1 Tax=Priapulus caudatus TaxID=37621 RepID=A0ABM1DYX1_PRICU|nr:PREDICTED: structural maintenance of chromosomes protein 6-like [Priapulus caudatus]
MPKRKANSVTEHPAPKQSCRPDPDNEHDQSDRRPGFTLVTTKTAESGIIEGVSLKNFMCHNDLSFNFGPNVNFVIGRNGSGKSAVLTAVVIGLGGKANVTNRGTSVKSFIKTGKGYGEVTVKLSNKGPDAFKPNLYGDSVTVERRLTQDGSSSYKLRGKSGDLISTKRDELTHLMEQFNIQVDNPISVLNQETSRNFLNSKNASDKYKFFLKATQLEQMKRAYNEADERCREATGLLATKRETMAKMEKEVAEWDRRFRAVKSLDNLREKIEKLKNESAWAQVAEVEQEVNPLQKGLETEDGRTVKFTGKVEETIAKIQKEQLRIQELRDELKQISDQARGMDPDIRTAKDHLDVAKKDIRTHQMKIKEIERQLRQLKNDRQEISTRIEELKTNVQENRDAERREREQKIAQLEEELKALSAQMNTKKHDLDQFQGAVNKAKEDQLRMRREEQGLRELVDRTKRDLRDLEESKTDRFRIYGQWVPQLIREVENAHKQGKFHQKPRGPIGAYMELTDQRWALAVEQCLGGLMFAWCVNDHHDAGVLERIMVSVLPRNNKKPQMLISRFKERVYDVSAFEAKTRAYATVLHTLTTRDPIVTNFLIDLRGVESVVLIKDNTEARRVMQYSLPANCHEAFTLSGDQVLGGKTFRYYSCPSYAQAKFLKKNIEEDINALKEKSTNLNVQLRQLQCESRTADATCRENLQQKNKTDTHIMRIQEAVRKKRYEIAEFANVEEVDPIDIATLEEELLNCDAQHDRLQQTEQEVTALLNGSKSTQTEALNRYNALTKQLEEIKEKVIPQKSDLAETEQQIALLREHQKHYNKQLQEHLAVIQTITKQLKQQKTKVEEYIGKATQICERVNTRRSPRTIDSDITQCEKRLKEKETTQGYTKEEVINKYHEISQKSTFIQTEIANASELLKKFSLIMMERESSCLQFRRMISLRVRNIFNIMLEERQCSGRMMFDHKKEVLEIVVPQAGHGVCHQGHRSLSGEGNASASTRTCFVLGTVWDAMGSEGWTEYDVYMDMVNRRLCMDMMLVVAKEQRNRQFIFFTPLDMSHLRLSNLMRVYEMPEPERGQMSLPFKPANHKDKDKDSGNTEK